MQRQEADTDTRVRLSPGRVLRAAVALADRDGLGSLTMRRLADHLGVGAMSLYHHVPNKTRLLDGMVDLVFDEIEVPTDVDWRTAMRRRANSTREALARHRWAVGLLESRLTPGPSSIRAHEALLRCLREAGFSVPMAVHANSVLDAYIYGFALQEATVPFDSAEEAAEVAAQHARLVTPEENPYLAEVVGGYIATSGWDFADEFAYGLDLILESLEARRDS